MKRYLTFLLVIVIFLFSCQNNQKNKNEPKPNIIYILADDLGYGDLSCYGQTKFSTPNIDKLAESGLKFTQHYSGSSVCAPSRSTLMTGQHTGHTFIRGNKPWKSEGQHPLEAKVLTVAEILKDAGYKTGAFGKWGLGFIETEGDPNKQGFDEFYGYNCQRKAHNYYPYHLWHNKEKIILKGNEGTKTKEYGPELIHKEALKFIVDNKDEPFFMYYPSIIPHAELFAPEEFMQKYRGKFMPEKKHKGADVGHKNYRNGAYGSQTEGHAAFAAMVNYLDMQVGEIVDKLKELGIYENTLIIFTSDNGPHKEAGADPNYFNSNGGLRGYKRDLYEGGIRVPMITVWDKKIKPGQETDHVSAFWDFMPTVTEIIGAEKPQNIDGISFLPSLLNSGTQEEHEYLYWEFHEKGGRQAIRKGKWKGIRYNVNDAPDATIELYNLEKDPSETKNIAIKHPEIVQKLEMHLKTARTESDIFSF